MISPATENSLARLSNALRNKTTSSGDSAPSADANNPGTSALSKEPTTSEQLSATKTPLDLLRASPSPIENASPISATSDDDQSEMLTDISDAIRAAFRQIEIDRADARLLAAGDNYDQLHIINPRTGVEYTDREVRLVHHADAERADARVVAAGDNYDLQHFINPRTGNEYTDAEVRVARNNASDSFRQNLGAADQIAYDLSLAQIRDNPGIQFAIDPGIDRVEHRDTIEANQELAYRGLAATTFGQSEVIDELFSEDAPYTIELLPDNPVTDSGTVVGAIAQPDRIIIKFDEASSRLDNGSSTNIFAHEFVHVLQQGDAIPPHVEDQEGETIELQRIFTEARDGSTPEGIELARLLDADYPATSSESRGLERWLDGDTANAEPFAVAAGYFYQSPELLAQASPELYALMVRVTGVDPLASSAY